MTVRYACCTTVHGAKGQLGLGACLQDSINVQYQSSAAKCAAAAQRLRHTRVCTIKRNGIAAPEGRHAAETLLGFRLCEGL